MERDASVPLAMVLVLVLTLMAGSIGEGWVGHSPAALDRRLDAVEQRVLVLEARTADLTTAPPFRVLTYAEWRALEPPRIVTEDEMAEALTAAGMPAGEAALLARAAAECEAPARDRDGTSIGAHMDRPGDAGRALTAFQIRSDVHTEKVAGRDLALLTDAAAVAVAIRNEAVQMGRAPLSPWSCVR